MSKQTYEEVLASFDMKPEDFAEMIETLSKVHEIAQQFSMLHVERCDDLGVSHAVGMLAMYQIARFQVVTNLRMGNIERSDIRGSKVAMEMLRELRHPDGNYPMLQLNEEGNFERIGTHREKP